MNLYERLVEKSSQETKPVFLLKTIAPDVYNTLVIRHPQLNSQLLFDFLNPTANRICLECGQPTRFKRFQVGYAEYCGLRCKYKPGNTRVARIVETNLDRYGVSTPAQNAQIHQRMVLTMRSRYGVSYSGQSPKLLSKAKATTKKRYGATHWSQVESLRIRHEEKLLAKYGVRHNAQRPEVFERIMAGRYRRTPLRLGQRVLYLQGYEPQTFNLLIRLGVPPFFEKPASVPYSNDRRYFPDFQIGNLIVEVKSDYTAGLLGDADLRRNLVAKLKGARAIGRDFLLLIMNKDGSLHKVCFNSFKLSRTVHQFRTKILCSAVSNYV